MCFQIKYGGGYLFNKIGMFKFSEQGKNSEHTIVDILMGYLNIYMVFVV